MTRTFGIRWVFMERLPYQGGVSIHLLGVDFVYTPNYAHIKVGFIIGAVYMWIAHVEALTGDDDDTDAEHENIGASREDTLGASRSEPLNSESPIK